MHPDAHGLISRTAALEAGYSNTDLQRLCSRGELGRIVPGMYAPRDVLDGLDRQKLHQLTTIALIGTNADDSVASHVSAAVLHDLDLWDTSLDRVHLTVPGGKRRTTSGLHVHSNALHPEFVTSSNGIAVTTLDRTVVPTVRGCWTSIMLW